MKKIRICFTLIILMTLLLAMIYGGKTSKNEVSKTEFLFDTPCSITVFKKSEKAAIDAAFDEAARVHRLADFFDENSEVSKINSANMGEWISVDRSIIEMLDLAQQIYDLSDGAFDISIARVMRLWDFGSENPSLPTDEEIKEALKFSGMENIVFDKDASKVQKKQDETWIDLGGIAKGYAADRAIAVLKESGVKSAIIDFGGNIVTLGKNPKTKDGMWRIGLQKPFSPNGEYEEVLKVGEKAVATSGSYQRNFTYGGELYHHIIDPKTGRPSKQDFSGVTVKASYSALADALGTAVFVLGCEKGTKLLENFDAEAVFLD